MKITLKKFGDGFYLNIPTALMNYFNLKEGNVYELKISQKGDIIYKLVERNVVKK